MLIPPERLIEDLHWLDEQSPPLLDGWGRNRCKWAAERIAALEAALKPFAATGAVLETKPKDEACWAGQTPAPPITFGHLRAAARAIAS